MSGYLLSFHGTAIGRGSVPMLIKAAKHAGFDCVETNVAQLGHFFQAGYTVADVNEVADGMPIAAVGWLSNCERQGFEYIQLMSESEKLFDICKSIGAKSVQVLTGPVDYKAVESFRNKTPYSGYMALQGLDLTEQKKMTAKNLADMGRLAAQFGLTLYFEPLCWAPINSIKQGVEICKKVDLDNVKMVVDFFHGFIAGDTPEYIAKMDPALIDGVHVCDSLKNPDGVPVETVLRNVKLGEGELPIQEWVDAVKATGYSGTWAYESFYRKEHELDPSELAKNIYAKMVGLLGPKFTI